MTVDFTPLCGAYEPDESRFLSLTTGIAYRRGTFVDERAPYTCRYPPGVVEVRLEDVQQWLQ